MSRNPHEHDLFARVPKWVWAALVEEASKDRRSATGQLVYILQTRYADRAPTDPPKRPRRKKAKE